MNLNQVTLACTDLEKSIAFYRTLGLKLIVHAETHYARFACPDGDSSLSLHRVEGRVPASTTMVYFECPKLDQTVKQLQEQGMVFDQTPVDQPWLWREAHVGDPDGNRIILFYAGENRLNPPWKIA